MAPTELIFAEAKQRPPPPREPRRPSTIVDANGCVITRGFVVPSRSSSVDSVAVSSTTSSFDAANAPFPRIAESSSSRTLPPTISQLSAALKHRTTRSTGNINLGGSARPALGDRRDTWQGTSLVRKDVVRSSRWENDELATTRCMPRRDPTEHTGFPHFFNSRAYTMPQMPGLGRPAKPAKTPQIRFKEPSMAHRSSSREPRRKSSKTKQPKPACSPAVDGSAIASDSEDDQMTSPRAKGRKKSSLPYVDKVPYATRRAMNDTQQQCQTPAPRSQPLENSAIASDDDEDDEDDFLPDDHVDICRMTKVTYAERRARSDGPILYPDPVQVTNHPPDSEESAVASDSEDEEDATTSTGCDAEELSAKLELANIHRKRNSQTIEVEERRLEEEEGGSSIRARVTTFNSTATITEVRMYVPGASLGPQRNLRPSRSRPRPAKGVLKSRSQSRSGRSPAERNSSNRRESRTVQPEEVAVRFAPAV